MFRVIKQNIPCIITADATLSNKKDRSTPVEGKNYENQKFINDIYGDYITRANADFDTLANERFCTVELFRFQPAAKHWRTGQFGGQRKRARALHQTA